MVVGSGYIAMGAGSVFPFVPPTPADTHTQSVSFNGKINNGIINVNVSKDLYNVNNGVGNSFNTNANLIGNPYPSAIDINKLMANNASVLQGTFYFWTHDSSINSANPGPNAYEFTNADYAIGTSDGITFLPVSAGSAGTTAPQFIASGQGFLANVKNNGIVTFNNSMRETGNNTFFRNTEDEVAIDKIWFNLTDDSGFYRQILVAFSSNGSDGFTNGQDAMRLETGLEGDFYSIMQSEPNNKYAIQTLAILNNEKTIPLGVKLYNTNSYVISIDQLEGNLENTNIYLKDNLFNTITDLKLSDYTFDAQIGQIDNRFELMFSRDALSTNTVSVENTDLVISNFNNEIHLEMLNQENITKIQAYDVIGKLVLQANTNNSSIDLNTTIKNGTVLIFKVKLANGQTLTKKFIKF